MNIRACKRSGFGAENGAEWAENRVSRSAAVRGHAKKRWSRSGVRSGGVVEWEQSGERTKLAAQIVKFRSKVICY